MDGKLCVVGCRVEWYYICRIDIGMLDSAPIGVVCIDSHHRLKAKDIANVFVSTLAAIVRILYSNT